MVAPSSICSPTGNPRNGVACFCQKNLERNWSISCCNPCNSSFLKPLPNCTICSTVKSFKMQLLSISEMSTRNTEESGKFFWERVFPKIMSFFMILSGETSSVSTPASIHNVINSASNPNPTKMSTKTIENNRLERNLVGSEPISWGNCMSIKKIMLHQQVVKITKNAFTAEMGFGLLMNWIPWPVWVFDSLPLKTELISPSWLLDFSLCLGKILSAFSGEVGMISMSLRNALKAVSSRLVCKTGSSSPFCKNG